MRCYEAGDNSVSTCDWSDKAAVSIWQEGCLCIDLYESKGGVGCSERQKLEVVCTCGHLGTIRNARGPI